MTRVGRAPMRRWSPRGYRWQFGQVCHAMSAPQFGQRPEGATPGVGSGPATTLPVVQALEARARGSAAPEGRTEGDSTDEGGTEPDSFRHAADPWPRAGTERNCRIAVSGACHPHRATSQGVRVRYPEEPPSEGEQSNAHGHRQPEGQTSPGPGVPVGMWRSLRNARVGNTRGKWVFTAEAGSIGLASRGGFARERVPPRRSGRRRSPLPPPCRHSPWSERRELSTSQCLPCPGVAPGRPARRAGTVTTSPALWHSMPQVSSLMQLTRQVAPSHRV